MSAPLSTKGYVSAAPSSTGRTCAANRIEPEVDAAAERRADVAGLKLTHPVRNQRIGEAAGAVDEVCFRSEFLYFGSLMYPRI